MFLAYLAALAAPVPAAPLEHKFDLAEDIPVLCQLQFEDQMRLIDEGKDPDSLIIDMYAERSGISDKDKVLVESFCQMFNIGALYALMRQEEESADKETTSESYVASFVR